MQKKKRGRGGASVGPDFIDKILVELPVLPVFGVAQSGTRP